MPAVRYVGAQARPLFPASRMTPSTCFGQRLFSHDSPPTHRAQTSLANRLVPSCLERSSLPDRGDPRVELVLDRLDRLLVRLGQAS